VIDGYDSIDAPSIALPRTEHRSIPTIRGEFNGNARDLMAKDIKDLRANTGSPNSSLQDLISQAKDKYPEMRK